MAPRIRSSRRNRSAHVVHGRAANSNWETDLLIRSHSELGVFPHNYLSNGRNCKSHPQQIIHEVEDSEADTSDSSDSEYNYGGPDLVDRKNGVSALTFDNQGRYLAAGTRAGCLTVYDFESLYCHTQDGEDQSKQLAHRSDSDIKQINAIKWNPADQNEIACGSRSLYDVQIFDCNDLRSKAVCKRRVNNHDWDKGLSDVAFASTNPSCIVASDSEYPTVGVWDTRERDLPIRQLESGLDRSLNSIQYLDGSGDQILVGGGSSGYMCLWDLRSGAAPIQQWQLPNLLEAQNLNEGAGRLVLDIDTIGFNPSNQTQLAFHVNNGWSGIFDLHSTTITHIHRPYVLPGLKEACRDPFCLRRSSWLSTTSVYMAPARNASGIFLLDFHRSTDSPYHVDSVWKHRDNNQGFMALSQTIITCAAHPRCGDIVAGTEDTSLLVISTKGRKVEGEEGKQGSGR